MLVFSFFNWQNEPIHMGHRDFRCPFCPKKSGTKQHMQYHIRTHTGEKPFKCYLCDKKFNRKESRDQHIKIIHQQWIHELTYE